jgi:hypothetical protein
MYMGHVVSTGRSCFPGLSVWYAGGSAGGSQLLASPTGFKWGGILVLYATWYLPRGHSYNSPGIESAPDATTAIFVKKKTKGTRSTKRHATKGRNGTDSISLWREIIVMIKAKGLAVSAALDLLAASEILSCFSLNHRKKWSSIEFGLASR